MPLIYDNFERADSSSLGGDWSLVVGTWGISSNRAYTRDSFGNHAALHETAVGGDDHYVEANGVEFDASGSSEIVLLARHPDDSTQTGYALWVRRDGEVRIRRYVDDDDYTTLETENMTVGAGPHDWLFEVEGSDPVTMRGYMDGVEVISTTDASGDRIESGQYVGFRAFDNGGDQTTYVDEVAADTLAPAPTPAPTGLAGEQVPAVALSWDDTGGPYTVRRDGSVIASGLAEAEYVDSDVAVSQSYSYTVEGDAEVESDPVSVTIVEGEGGVNYLRWRGTGWQL